MDGVLVLLSILILVPFHSSMGLNLYMILFSTVLKYILFMSRSNFQGVVTETSVLDGLY